MRCFIVIPAALLFSCSALGQQAQDSIQLKEISVSTAFSPRPLLRLTSSAGLLDTVMLKAQSGNSLLSAANTIPGVRMEERSPASYRFSIRGSLIRSPFGIRNVKMYVNGLPLTDGTGNTYLNLLDASLIHRMEVLKGPDGSLFGANSGGVAHIDLLDHSDSSAVTLGLRAGSFGLFHETVSLRHRTARNNFSLAQSRQTADGYRRNSAMSRNYFQIADNWSYSANAELRVLFFYSDLRYETPGGLTKAQLEKDPRMARPATAFLPGAEEQKAGVHNRTLYGGILNRSKVRNNLHFSTAIFGSHTGFENPFITNYEVREERNLGVRAFLEAENDEQQTVRVKWEVGMEAQENASDIRHYANEKGVKGELQDKNRFEFSYGFLFSRLTFDVAKRVLVEASCSYNMNTLRQSGFVIYAGDDIAAQLMPRLGVSWVLLPGVAWRASASKGYSPPTLAEVFSSGNILNRELEPESGYNYETGFRIFQGNERWWWDVSAFYYLLDHAIVRRSHETGEEYFINAGGTKQTGIESELRCQVVAGKGTGFIRGLELRNSSAYSLFRFRDYVTGTDDCSENDVTGVPQEVITTDVLFGFPANIYFNARHQYTAALPLNDGNTEYAEPYQLLELKIGYRFFLFKRLQVDVSLGAENLLDARYSAGNDLNAAGGRYYNPAAPRTFYGGVILRSGRR